MSCNTDRRTITRRQGVSPNSGGVVEGAERSTRASRNCLSCGVDVHRVHQTGVDHYRVALREAFEAMASATERKRNVVKSQPLNHCRHSTLRFAQGAQSRLHHCATVEGGFVPSEPFVFWSEQQGFCFGQGRKGRKRVIGRCSSPTRQQCRSEDGSAT